MGILQLRAYVIRFRQALSLIHQKEYPKFGLLLVANSLVSIIEAAAIALLYSFFSVAMGTDTVVFEKLVEFSLIQENDTPNDVMVVLSMGIIAVFVLRTVFVLSVRWYYLSFIKDLTTRVSRNLFNAYVDATYREHLEKSSGFIINNIWGNAKPVVVNCTAGIIEIFAACVMMFSISIVMFYNEPVVTSVLVLSMVFMLLFYLTLMKNRIHMWGERGIRLTEGVYDIIEQAIAGIQSVKIFSLQSIFKNNFDQLVMDQTCIVRKNTFFAEAPRYVIEVVIVSAIMMLIIVSFNSGGDVKGIIPSLVLFGTSSFRIIPSVSKLIAQLQAFKFTIPAMDRVLPDYKIAVARLKKVDRKSGVNSAQNKLKFSEKIEFRDVQFSYDNEHPVLDGINLTVQKGQFVGFVGESGSGKTTALNILMGLLEPGSGQVIVDGKDLKGTKDSLRLSALFSFVPQSPFTLNGTFQENVTLMQSGRSEKAFDEAVRLSKLEKRLARMPKREMTMLGGGQYSLSGGEAQRLSFARALFSDRDIIALDEPTSALDPNTETEIMSNLHTQMAGKTIVMVAHRLYTLRTCDVIYVFENGKIIASGSFDYLRENCSSFSEMLQSAGSH